MARVPALLTTMAFTLLALLVAVWIQDSHSLHFPFQRAISASSDDVYAFTQRPHVAPWSTWFSPEIFLKDKVPSRVTENWNILYHLGGNGPWIQKLDGVVSNHIGPPDGCVVDQVHMLSRHAERYPTMKVGAKMLALLTRLKDPDVTLSGDLAFVKDWQYFANNPQGKLEQLTSTGPYAGTLEAFTTGVRMKTRYSHLMSQRLPAGGGKTSLWASGSTRVIETARIFAAGIFGLDWKDTAELHAIPETVEQGGDTLTPGDTCLNYIEDVEHGHDQGVAKLKDFAHTYLPTIAVRLQDFTGLTTSSEPLHFHEDEIYAMQEMCGFEILVRGTSPWCDIFTHAEWEAFEYARDVIHYYRSGPGTKYSVAMGGLWLNATARLLLDGPKAGPFFFSFVHDGDISPMLSALDLYHDDEVLPVTHVHREREWRTSQTMPMGGRVIFERLTCTTNDDFLSATPSAFVRLNVNDGIVALPDCTSGPGQSCPLQEFATRIKHHEERGGNFRTMCGLKADVPDHITFLHQ